MIYRKNVFYDTEKVERRCGMLRRVTQESLFRSTVTALSHRRKGCTAMRNGLFSKSEKPVPHDGKNNISPSKGISHCISTHW